jgi:hypothetical protein
MMRAQVAIALDNVLAPDFAEGAKLVLKAKGAEVGFDDAGNVVVGVGGKEEPLTREALERIIGPQYVRPSGHPGTGINDAGGAAWNPPDPLDYLRSQEEFERHRKEVLEAVAARHRR